MPPEQKHVGRFTKKTNDPPRGNNYLIAIAIDKYKHAPPLSNCVRDAEDFIQILTSKYDFEQKKDGQQLIFTLFNEQATRKNILKNSGN